MFKDQIANDLEKVFLNDTEFSETVRIDDKDIVVTIDYDLTKESYSDYDGIIVGDIKYFTKASNFVKIPKYRDVQRFNGKVCTILDIKNDTGMLEVILQRNEG
jgi:hypothetical protein